MSTTDEVFIIILSSLLSLFFILLIALVVLSITLVGAVKRVVQKAEGVVDSVEEAAEVFRDTQGRLALFKVIRNIIKLANRRR